MYRIIILSVIFSCNVKNEATDIVSKPTEENIVQLTGEQARNADITTSNLTIHASNNKLRLYGKSFYPPESIHSIASSFGGMVASIPVVQGQYVARGQTVVILEDPKYIDLQEEYLLLKSNLKMVKLNYHRQKELNESKANSDKVYEQSEAEYQSNKIRLQALSEKLKLLGINPSQLNENNISKRITIKATNAGSISNIYGNKGKYTLPSESIIDIVNQSEPMLKLKVYEKDVSRIYAGQAITAYQSHNIGEKFNFIVKNISPSVSSDGSFDVICTVKGKPKKIFQNVNFIADLEVSSQVQNSLAENTVLNYEGENYLFVEIGKNKFKMIPVFIGKTANGFVEIGNIEDFKGKKIVTNGAYNLLMTLKNKED